MSADHSPLARPRAREHVSMRGWSGRQAAIALGCILLGVLIDRTYLGLWGSSSPRSGAQVVVERVEGVAAPRTPPKRALTRPFLVRPATLFTATDVQAEQRYRQQQSRDLMDLLRSNVTLAEKFYPGSAEGVLNQVAPYMDGWIQAVERTAPDLVDELAGEAEKTLCDTSASDAQLIATTRLLGKLPELGSERAFGCLFSEHPEEGPVLWSALDAFHLSGLPRTQELASIAAHARDERTLRRLEAPASSEDEAEETPPLVRRSTPSDARADTGEDGPSAGSAAPSLKDLLKR